MDMIDLSGSVLQSERVLDGESLRLHSTGAPYGQASFPGSLTMNRHPVPVRD
jgi:hypothetical protein